MPKPADPAPLRRGSSVDEPTSLPRLQKSNPDSPTWFLVNVTYRSRLAHPVTLALLKHIATVTSPSAVHALGTGAGWFGAEELACTSLRSLHSLLAVLPSLILLFDLSPPAAHVAIKSLPLINRGRLSVQPVPDAGFATIVRLGEEGGWSEEIATGKKPKATKAVKGATKKEEAADSGEAGSSTAATAPAEKEEGVAIGRGGKGLKKRAYDSGGGGDKKKVKEEDGVNVEVGAGQVAVAPDGRRKSARNK